MTSESILSEVQKKNNIFMLALAADAQQEGRAWGQGGRDSFWDRLTAVRHMAATAGLLCRLDFAYSALLAPAASPGSQNQ